MEAATIQWLRKSRKERKKKGKKAEGRMERKLGVPDSVYRIEKNTKGNPTNMKERIKSLE